MVSVEGKEVSAAEKPEGKRVSKVVHWSAAMLYFSQLCQTAKKDINVTYSIQNVFKIIFKHFNTLLENGVVCT